MQQLQGHAVADATPSANNVLKWNGTLLRWEPSADDAGSDNQNLAIVGDSLKIERGVGVNLAAYMDNTDAQNLHLLSDSLSISGGNYVKFVGWDRDASNDVITSTAFGGDVAGTYDALTVQQLQGHAVATWSPAIGQVLMWRDTLFQWAPTTLPAPTVPTFAEVLEQGNDMNGFAITDTIDNKVDILATVSVMGGMQFNRDGYNTTIRPLALSGAHVASLPNASGEISLLGQSIDSEEITESSIDDSHIAEDAAIAWSKIDHPELFADTLWKAYAGEGLTGSDSGYISNGIAFEFTVNATDGIEIINDSLRVKYDETTIGTTEGYLSLLEDGITTKELATSAVHLENIESNEGNYGEFLMTRGSSTGVTWAKVPHPAGTNGAIQFASDDTFASSSAFKWDDYNSRLGVNLSTAPNYTLDVDGDIYASGRYHYYDFADATAPAYVLVPYAGEIAQFAITDLDICNWHVTDSILWTDKLWGIARGNASNYATQFSQVNLGIACTTSGEFSSVLAGYANRANDDYTVIAGGAHNKTGWGYTFIGGGDSNEVVFDHAAIVGGKRNIVQGSLSFIGTGSGNTIAGGLSSIVGGTGNSVGGHFSTIAGGDTNTVNNSWAFIGGGRNNHAYSNHSAIVGGSLNYVDGMYSFAGNGYADSITGANSAIITGELNKIQSGGHHAIASGYSNTIASGWHNFIGAGYENYINCSYAGIVNGYQDSIFGQYGFIGGGKWNMVGTTTAHEASAIMGGISNAIEGSYSAIAGGFENYVGGDYSFAFGNGVYIESSYNAVFYDELYPGYVGINNSYPSEALDVIGNVKIDGSIELLGGIRLGEVFGDSGEVLMADGEGGAIWSTVSQSGILRDGNGVYDFEYDGSGDVNVELDLEPGGGLTYTEFYGSQDEKLIVDGAALAGDGLYNTDAELSIYTGVGLAIADDSLFVDEYNIPYTPANTGNWSGETDPGNVNDALDELAVKAALWIDNGGSISPACNGNIEIYSEIDGAAIAYYGDNAAGIYVDCGGQKGIYTSGANYGLYAATSGNGGVALYAAADSTIGQFAAILSGHVQIDGELWVYGGINDGSSTGDSGQVLTANGYGGFGWVDLPKQDPSCSLSADVILPCSGDSTQIITMASQLAVKGDIHAQSHLHIDSLSTLPAANVESVLVVESGVVMKTHISAFADSDWTRSGNMLYTYSPSDKVGIGTSTPTRVFEVVGTADSFMMPIAHVNNLGTAGCAIYGQSNNPSAMSGVGVMGVGKTVGVKGSAVANSSMPVYGVQSEASAIDGIGSAYAFYGYASGKGMPYGAWVMSYAESTAFSAYGLYASASAHPTVMNVYGIYASAMGGQNAYAGYFDGRVKVMSNFELNARFIDSSGDSGAIGQILTSTGWGTDWQTRPQFWTLVDDTVLRTTSEWGLTRNAGNTLLGIYRNTHLNFGSNCTTGTSANNYAYCTVVNGYMNVSGGDRSFVGSGDYNRAMGERSFVGAGSYNEALAPRTTVVGGGNNKADGYGSFVGGGFYNKVLNDFGFIGGGVYDSVFAVSGVIVGGKNNRAGYSYADTGAAVLGGIGNYAKGRFSSVVGGFNNATHGDRSVVVGGSYLRVGARSFGFRGGILDNPSALLDVSSDSSTFHIVDAKFRFNYTKVDADFRIDGDNLDNVFFMDATTDRIGVRTNAPSSAHEINGSKGWKVSEVASGDTLNETHNVVYINSTVTATVYLPDPSTCPNRVYTVKRKGSGIVSVNGGSYLIDGNSSVNLSAIWDFVTVISTGSEWLIIGK